MWMNPRRAKGARGGGRMERVRHVGEARRVPCRRVEHRRVRVDHGGEEREEDEEGADHAVEHLSGEAWRG